MSNEQFSTVFSTCIEPMGLSRPSFIYWIGFLNFCQTTVIETLLNSSESIKRLSCIYGMDYTYLSLQLCSSMFAVYESLHIKLTHRIHVWYIYLNTFIIYYCRSNSCFL